MSRNRAFTLVELLVVIAIIGILMSLLIPGMSAMRELGRRTQCQNNVKQMSTAINAHLVAQGHFPTGGWGYGWVGDPDCGFGLGQPGGWIYNILPFMDAVPIYEMGRTGKRLANLTGDDWTKKRAAFRERVQIPIAIFNCPSRRRAATYPASTTVTYNYDMPSRVARTDYAANRGCTASTWGYAGPSQNSLPSEATLAQRAATSELSADGVMFYLSQITPAHVRDGLSTTYLVGEKHLCPSYYASGNGPCDDQNLYIGDDMDIARWTYGPPLRDTDTTTIRTANGAAIDLTRNFGSAHPSGFNAAFCDGSVHLISYTIDPVIHAALGTRDGLTKTNPATNAEEMPVDQSKVL